MRHALPVRGFTLIEMVTTLAIIAILVSIAVPSFVALMASQGLETAASSLQFALLTTRSEALKRNTNVILAPNTPAQWNTGWTISGVSTGASSGGPVPNITITGPATVTYQGSGRLVSGSASSVFKLSSPKTQDFRCVFITLSGTPNIASTGC